MMPAAARITSCRSAAGICASRLRAGRAGPGGHARIRSADLRGKQRVVSEDEERFAIRAAEDELQRSLGHIDLRNLPARRRVDEDLSVGNVDIAAAIDRDALAAALRKRLQVRECAVRVRSRAVGDVLGLAGHINALARMRVEKSVSVEIVAESPAGDIVRRTLLEDAARGQKYAVIR